MKKLMLLSAAVLALQAIPALADDHEGGKKDRGAKMFDMQDTNKDGMISESEFVDHAKKRFTDMDGNKDGNVTKDEAKSHYEAKKAEWKEKRAKMKAAKEAAPVTTPAPVPAE